MKQQKRIYPGPAVGDKILAVVNPTAGNGRTELKWPEYEREFKRKGLNIDVVYTEAPGHAVELTKQALKEGYPNIMSVGGDGTVNEVVQGFFERGVLISPESRLLVFSQGTGSDFIRSLGLVKGPEQMLDVIENGEINWLDLGKVTYVSHQGHKKNCYFINLADAGIGGETVAHIDQSSKRFGGFITYLVGALKTLVNYKNKPFRLFIDGQKVKEEILNSVIIANGSYFAGGMEIAPGAELKSGQLEIVVIGDMSRGEIVTNLYKAYSGNHLDHPKVDIFQGKEIIIESEERVFLNIDGEAAGRLPAKFEILSSKLPVLVV